MIFDKNATVSEKHQAFLILQLWKARRSQETLTGVLCTLSLLDVYLKDETGKISDPFTLSTLYASSLTKFINFATSFQINDTSMYRSANKLGLDSFLVDLRHMCAHGKQQPCLEVFRKSHRYCLEWIRKFFWESELKNVTDATSKDIRFDETMADGLKEKFSLFDMCAELLHKNIVFFDDLTKEDSVSLRWPTINQFMKEKKVRNFRQGLTSLTEALTRIIESKPMQHNPRTFFHEMLERCGHFMNAADYIDKDNSGVDVDNEDDDNDTPPAKRRKRKAVSIVNLYQNIIWQIAKNDYLKLFLDMLYQLSLNESEDANRRASARFWITIILRSLRYYQRYCEFSKNGAILQKKITDDIRNIYSYQFDADLKLTIIFVGTQMLPHSLKYSKEFFVQVLNNVDENNVSVCISLLPFVYPPLTTEQLEKIGDLIKIKTETRNASKSSTDIIHTVEDFFPTNKETIENNTTNVIWQKSTDNIDWSSQPIGKDFSFKV